MIFCRVSNNISFGGIKTVCINDMLDNMDFVWFSMLDGFSQHKSLNPTQISGGEVRIQRRVVRIPISHGIPYKIHFLLFIVSM